MSGGRFVETKHKQAINLCGRAGQERSPGAEKVAGLMYHSHTSERETERESSVRKQLSDPLPPHITWVLIQKRETRMVDPLNYIPWYSGNVSGSECI